MRTERSWSYILKTMAIGIAILGIMYSCKPVCKEGEEYICGKGCVAKAIVQPQVESQSEVVAPIEEFKPEPKKLPSYTAFKVSDIVCVWGKEEGVVVGIIYGKVPEGHDDVLLYEIAFPDPNRINEHYYETELKKGKCNSY